VPFNSKEDVMNGVKRLIVATATTALLGAAATLLIAAATPPVTWTAGGLSAGTDSAGQSARMAVDPLGNVAIVSGPSNGADLAITSYTPSGGFRWRTVVSPSIGTFAGDWVAAAADGDFVAVGHNVTSRGNPIAITIVRFSTAGALLWRVDLARTFPGVGRLIVDSAGNAYLAFNSVGDGQDIQLHKYSPSGQLLWAQVINTGFMANDIATSIALSPDDAHIVLTGQISGGATWITAAYSTTTGARRWLVTAAEGLGARDVVVDDTRAYVVGQGATGAGTPQLAYWLTVVAYDRFTGKRLWRTDTKPDDAGNAAGLWIARAPDGSVVATGQAQRGFLDWYTVAFETFGAIRWSAVRDGGLNTDEIPRALLVLDDGTTVVTGRGGPNLPGGFIPGVTAGYGPDGTLLWEAFSTLETVWASALPNGDVCATGGYDALITCWQVPGSVGPAPPIAVVSAVPSSGVAPLTVTFDGSTSHDPDGAVTSWAWSFGDGTFGTGPTINHVYSTPGVYTASLTVTDVEGLTNRATATITVQGRAPEAPTNLKAKAFGRTSIVLTWTNGTVSQSGIMIERCAGSACSDFVQIGMAAGTATSITDSGLARQTSYTYRVRARNVYGESPYSNTATARTNR
jgi:chitodextrinase